ncbi:PREDICTED: uncharacterized protein LOC105555911 [Vollenhovia emeryi]|uniref:uncharacterized protein LOC105555911 n=1 Tax=Vollenhovia emeryi TaxID=411798 RepID=UPI0005F42F47|nr:PREDICTED: uncharacterized protein LOC105555911 [Vollenhovia emeryi]
MLTIVERVDIISSHFEAHRNVEEARQRYANLFPDRNVPSATAFRSIVQLFTETGSVKPRERVRPRPVTNENNTVNVLAAVAANPHISSRQITRGSGISQRSVLRILHEHTFHPFHLSLHQELHGDDFQNRLNFCNWIQEQLAVNDNFILQILFSDESNFTNRGQVNRHNMHYWSVENPHWLRQVEHQRPRSVNVWCGILGTQVIGPYFIEEWICGFNTMDAQRIIHEYLKKF